MSEDNSRDTTFDTKSTEPTTAESNPVDALNETSESIPAVIVDKKNLPSLKDLPSLGANKEFAKVKVAWGPNMPVNENIKNDVVLSSKPSIASLESLPKLASSSSSSMNSNFRKSKSKTIQEAFTLDLESQLSITKQELSRIVLAIKHEFDVSIESTLSKNARTFLISGVASNVQEAKRELVKQITKPITVSFSIPSRCRAAIIGPGGKVIREISERYEVRIDVGKNNIEGSFDSELNDYLSNVTLTGDFQSVSMAKGRILDIVKEETKNITIRFTIDDSKITPFLDMAQFLTPEDVSEDQLKVQYYAKSGDIVIQGPVEQAKIRKAEIDTYLKSLANDIKEEQVKIPRKYQFLIDAEELRKKFLVSIEFSPEDAENPDLVCFIGEAGKVTEAIAYARSSSRSYVVEILDISKAHSKNLDHAKSLALYFHKYGTLNDMNDVSPEVKFVLPSVKSLSNSSDVCITLSAKAEFSDDLKHARKELVNYVNSISPNECRVLNDIDYELFSKEVKQILEKLDSEIHFVQYGDYYKDDDRILLISIASEDDFKPSFEEIDEKLSKANKALDTIRNKQNELHSEVIKFSSSLQDELLATGKTTLNLIHQQMSNDGVNVQIKLHQPKKDQITVRGTDQSVKEITKVLESISQSSKSESVSTLEIPTNVVSRLIGAKGANMQHIRELYGCEIDIPSNYDTSEKMTEVTFKGIEFNIMHAKKHVAAECKKLADVTTAELHVPSKFHRNLIGPRGLYRTRLQDKYGVYINFPKTGEIVTIRGPSRGVKKAHVELKALLDFEMENGHETIIKVPSEHVPRIIGKNGDNINDMRVEFGVEMEFLQKATSKIAQETGEVELQITGSRQAIKDATKRVNDFVKESSNYVTETLEVDPKFHKIFVGQGGRTLREIISNADGDDIKGRVVDIPDSNSVNGVITVQGPNDFVQKVIKQFKKIIDDREKSITKELEVSNERKGALIGTGGMVRRQLEEEFGIQLEVPAKDEKDKKVTIIGLPENVDKCLAKINSEILRDDFDREISIPASAYWYVVEQGNFIQTLRQELSINVRHGDSTRRANKLKRSKIVIPVEKVRPAEKESSKTVQIETLIENVGPAIDESETGDIQFKLTYEPIDLSAILGEDETSLIKPENKDSIHDNKAQALDKAIELLTSRVDAAKKAEFVGFVWCSDNKRLNKVVGPGGSNIKKIRSVTGAFVDVPRKTSPVNDIVYVRGSESGVNKAVEMISNSLK